MDAQSYDGYNRRLLRLESLLSPSFDAPPVLQQLEKLNRLVSEQVDGNFGTLFKLLNDSNIWHRLPTVKSEVEQDFSEDYKNIVLSNKERMMRFLKDYEEVIRLADLMNELIKSSSRHYEALLMTEIPIDAYNQVVENYSKLLVRSMLLLERNYKMMMRENQHWSDLEKQLSDVEREISKVQRKREIEMRYI